MNNFLQYPETNNNNNNNNSTQLQVWNNAAFDDGNDSCVPMNTSWSSSSECTKENLSPTALNSSPKPSKPKLKKTTTAAAAAAAAATKTKGLASNSDDRSIDDEIRVIENEIKRLTTRLDALRLEKAKRTAAVARVGRVVPAKFMEPKQIGGVLKKSLEETPKPKVNRRGMSLGPGEIAVASVPTTAPNRRKSCFWKLPEIGEEERGKTVGKLNLTATLGSRKCATKKKEEALVVQPRKLFGEREKPVCVSNKKGLKQGRVVASRYNQCGGGDAKKRSLTEIGGSEVRVKKRWEISKKSEEEEEELGLLQKIKTVRCVNESPRDSGAAKRVAELVGKRSYFCNDEKDFCQVLSFAEEEEEEEG